MLGDSLRTLEMFIHQKKHIICYGAGGYGRALLSYCKSRNIILDAFVVSNTEGKKDFFGIPLYQFGEQPKYENCGWIIGTSKSYQAEIRHILNDNYINDYFCMSEELVDELYLSHAEKNLELKGMAESERVFILGMGPSIAKQNLKLLKDETVFSCSWCSLLDDYAEISPAYFVTPSFWGDGFEDDRYIMDCLKFLDQHISSPYIICDCYDLPYMQNMNIFLNKKIYYMYQSGSWIKDGKAVYEMDKKTPGIQTASIMMLKIAMYMGYKKIYLLGTEHDLVKKKFEHSYDMNKLKGLGFNYLADKLMCDMYRITSMPNRQILQISLNMYDEYHVLHGIANHSGIEIYNATAGGSLDEFKRVDYDSLF